ncbi:uncharacterized protein LOC131597369 [Vicia villosa]|uniref:uncharacterized protein LOC131597369 n=1 Tax=Vicia villosa TaxID=3911 RepID=UPI00273CB855|nr:uncharacterized protein LOC131597369 [Vicia villosa]
MTATCGPIFKLLCKNQECKWTEECQKAFEDIKEYLLEPPILSHPVERRPLIMYLTILEDSMGCVMGQQDESGRKEYAIYYLSKKYTDYETRYSLLEKTCCTLVWDARRLRQYMLTHTTYLISKMDPIKYLFENPALTRRITRWKMLLSEYGIQYRAQKAIKGSFLADHLASQPIDDDQSLQDDFSDEEIIGIGAVIVMPQGSHVPFTARPTFDFTNNMAEDYTQRLLTFFNKVEFHHIPREENQMADVLETLASMYQVKSPNEAPQITITRLDRPTHVFAAEVVTNDKPWFYDIKIFLQKQEYPPGAFSKDRRTLRRLSSNFFLTGDVLYKRNFDMVLLRCMDRYEANQLMPEIHEGSFGTHANGHAMTRKILRVGYY